MPSVTQTVQRSEEVTTVVAKDRDGAEVRIGDTVTITLEVTGVREMGPDPAAERAARDDLELAYIMPSGHRLHLCTVKSTMVRKLGEAPGDQPGDQPPV